jgi:hypothetical protein
MSRLIGAASLTAVAAAILVVFASAIAEAAPRPPSPYCLRGPTGSTACLYQTFAQCRAAASGTGASCRRNPRYGVKPNPRRR